MLGFQIFCLHGGDGVDADEVVRVTSEQGGAVGRPGEAGAVGGAALEGVELLGAEGVDDDLGLEVPDLDALVGGGAEPVAVGGEDEGVDGVGGVEAVEALALVEVPENGGAVLAAGGAEGAVGGDADGVEVAGVADEVVAELAVGEVPDLDEAVPAGGDDEGDGLAGAEADAGDPLGVALGLAAGGDGVLALAEGVPELDGLVAGAGDDLAVVDGKGDGEDVLGVADEAAGGLAGVDLPEAEGAVPGSGEGELTVGGDDDVGDEVGVAAEGAAGVAVGIVLAGAGVGEGPADDGLVTGGREDEVGVLGGGGDRGDPVAVATEGAAKGESFRHGSSRNRRDDKK